MKKTLLTLLVATFSFSTFAKQFICPQSITCNYEAGTCEQIDKDIHIRENGGEAFIGEKTINLSAIGASTAGIDWYNSENGKKINIAITPYIIWCAYSYNGGSIQLSKFVKKLVGNSWVTKGWGKTRHECPNVDPSACMATY